MAPAGTFTHQAAGAPPLRAPTTMVPIPVFASASKRLTRVVPFCLTGAGRVRPAVVGTTQAVAGAQAAPGIVPEASSVPLPAYTSVPVAGNVFPSAPAPVNCVAVAVTVQPP